MIWFGKKKEEENTSIPKAAPAPAPVVHKPVPAPAPAPAPAPVAPPPPPPPAPAPEPESIPPIVRSIPVSAPAPAPASAPAPTPAPAPKPAAPAPAAGAAKAQPNRKDLYYGLMNALYDVVLVVDDNAHLMDCNERVESVFGYSKDEIWDMPLSKLVPGINAVVFKQMKEILHDNRRVLVNARCKRKDGTMFPGEVGAGLMDLMGENVVMSVRNIEKRAPARAILRPANAAK